ncbi:Triosephosphate isomerase [Spironucleus salmonicida]|uniref:Triosephosphate isomerase n=2 Tax=Spironucleus TaxID=39709 RepID=V6LN56_9EUKA|nr:Triosephosphate isomerase [Spironucleus salmonicida]|eukprot:EST45141.1 Triosephosphate isomerase [Spironucleus salmonicida]
MVRTPIVGGNFKMNGTIKFINDHAEVLKSIAKNNVEVVMAPTALHASLLQAHLKDSHVCVAAQNVYDQKPGAFTGELAVEMLVDAGIKYAIIGHSERRRIMGESNEQSAKKTLRALEANITVLFCIGETLEERNANKVDEVNFAQLAALKAVITPQQWVDVVIAYEPVWSIGTGVVASPEQAQEVHASIRNWLKKEISTEVAEMTRIQYGGSVNGKNCAELSKCADIDGFLVGGAALKPEIVEIVKILGETKKQ